MEKRSKAKVALLVVAGAMVVAVVIWMIAVTALSNSDAFALGKAELQNDPKVSEVFGAPLDFGLPSGNIALRGGGNGTSELKFSLSGPKAHGTAFVVAHRALDVWRVESASVELDDGSRLERSVSAATDSPTQPEAAPAEPPPRLPELPDTPEPTGVSPKLLKR